MKRVWPAITRLGARGMRVCPKSNDPIPRRWRQSRIGSSRICRSACITAYLLLIRAKILIAVHSLAFGSTKEFNADKMEISRDAREFVRKCHDPVNCRLDRNYSGHSPIPIRLNVDFPAPIMVQLDRAITLNIVLMQMVRSSRTMTSKRRRHEVTSTPAGIRLFRTGSQMCSAWP